jgi:hypothetical protein
LLGGVVAIVADGPSDDRVVFLLDEAVIVLPVGSTARKGDLLIVAVAEKLVVDELGTIIGVDAEEWEGKSCAYFLKACKDMDLGFIFQGFGFGPRCRDVGERECLTVIIKGRTTIMGNEIGFTKTGSLLIPIGKGSDRDVVLEQGAGACERTASELTLALGLGQESISGRCADMQEVFTQACVAEGEYALLLQQGEDLPDECGEPFAAQAIGEGPELSQSIQEGFCSVEPCAMSLAARSTSMPRNKDDSPACHHTDLLPATVPQDKGSIRPGVACESNKTIENLAAFFLA